MSICHHVAFIDTNHDIFWHFKSQFLHYQPFAQLHVSTCWMRCHRIVRIAFKQVLQVAWVPMRFILQIDWSSNIGESAIDIVVFTSANAPLSIYVLGKRYKVVMVIIMISDMIFINLLLPLLLILLALYWFYAPINLKLQRHLNFWRWVYLNSHPMWQKLCSNDLPNFLLKGKDFLQREQASISKLCTNLFFWGTCAQKWTVYLKHLHI